MALIILKKVLKAVEMFEELNAAEQNEFFHIVGIGRLLRDDVRLEV